MTESNTASDLVHEHDLSWGFILRIDIGNSRRPSPQLLPVLVLLAKSPVIFHNFHSLCFQGSSGWTKYC